MRVCLPRLPHEPQGTLAPCSLRPLYHAPHRRRRGALVTGTGHGARPAGPCGGPGGGQAWRSSGKGAACRRAPGAPGQIETPAGQVARQAGCTQKVVMETRAGPAGHPPRGRPSRRSGALSAPKEATGHLCSQDLRQSHRHLGQESERHTLPVGNQRAHCAVPGDRHRSHRGLAVLAPLTTVQLSTSRCDQRRLPWRRRRSRTSHPPARRQCGGSAQSADQPRYHGHGAGFTQPSLVRWRGARDPRCRAPRTPKGLCHTAARLCPAAPPGSAPSAGDCR